MCNQSKLRWGQPTADELAAVIEYIKLLKKTNQFKVVRVVLLVRSADGAKCSTCQTRRCRAHPMLFFVQRVRHDLVKDADGFVDPLLNLPEHLHPVWRQIVACTQVWTDRMARKKKKVGGASSLPSNGS